MKTRYIAYDGKIFNEYDECEQYEESIREAAKKKVENLVVLSGKQYMPCDETTKDSEDTFTWYKAENEEQLNLVLSLYEFDIPSEITFPEYIYIARYDGGEIGYGGTLSESKDHITNLFDKLGYDVTFDKQNYN